MKGSGKGGKGGGKPQKQKSVGKDQNKPSKSQKIIKPTVRGR